MEGTLTPARDAPLEGMMYWVAYAATGIELLAVVLIVGVIVFATVSYSTEDHGAASGHDYLHRLSPPRGPRFAVGP